MVTVQAGGAVQVGVATLIYLSNRQFEKLRSMKVSLVDKMDSLTCIIVMHLVLFPPELHTAQPIMKKHGPADDMITAVRMMTAGLLVQITMTDGFPSGFVIEHPNLL